MNLIKSISQTYLTEILGVKKPTVLMVRSPGMWEISKED